MANDDTFNTAHTFVQRWEGGLVEDPDDAGGITNHGVSLRFLKDYRNGKATRQDIIDLTAQDAKKIFYTAFWKGARCPFFEEAVATVLYDTAVNCGASRAIKLLQKAAKVEADGIIGGKTLAAVRMQVDYFLAMAFIAERQLFYRELVRKKPSQQKFLKGWLNRTQALKKHIDRYALED